MKGSFYAADQIFHQPHQLARLCGVASCLRHRGSRPDSHSGTIADFTPATAADVENAIKACGEGGRVTLSCRSGVARVADNGKGMTAEQLSHITEPFYRTDRSRSRAEGGAGLGLTLCSQIAQAHSAALEFDSKPNEGTVVNVRFTNYLALDDNTITT